MGEGLGDEPKIEVIILVSKRGLAFPAPDYSGGGSCQLTIEQTICVCFSLAPVNGIVDLPFLNVGFSREVWRGSRVCSARR